MHDSPERAGRYRVIRGGKRLPQSLIQTSAAAGQPLRHGGALLISSHEQIAGLLRSRLGSNQAELLARPRVAADGSITWSTGLAGPVVRASQLGDAERADLQRRCERFVGNIRTLAQSLAAEGQDGLARSRLLDLALTRPSGDWLFSVDDRPVLAMWGHVGPADRLPPDSLATWAPPPVPASLPAQSPVPAIQTLEPALGVLPTPAAIAAAPTGPETGGRPVAAAPALPAAALAAGARPGWLPVAVGVFGLLTLALVAFAVWKLAGSALWPGAGGLDARITAAETRNTDLQTRLQARSGGALQCRPDDPAPAAGQGTATPAPAPSVVPPAATAPGPASPGGPPAAAPGLAPAPAPAPTPAPPGMPQMPELPRLPNAPGAAPASRTLQLPTLSGQALPPEDAAQPTQGRRPELLRRAHA